MSDSKFEKRFNPDYPEEAIDCDCCCYPGRLKLFKDTPVEGMNKRDLWLCEVCSSTFLSKARKYPQQCSDIDLYKSIAMLGNMLLEEIREQGKKP